jgi:hypothetical protein
MREAEKPSEQFNKNKLLPGKHVCIVEDVRVRNGFYGKKFWLDFVVESGPSGAGYCASWGINPDEAKGGPGLPAAKARALDIGKMQAVVAACFGYPADQAGLIDDVTFNAAIARPVSPLKGRKIAIDVRSHVNKKGEPGVFYVITPYELPEAPKASAAPSAPAAPPPAPSAPSFPPAGWAVHPENPAYFYQPGKPTTPITEAQLRAL